MLVPRYVIYCDEADDERLARKLFTEGPLANATIMRLPPRGVNLPPELALSLQWERSDWLITRDGVLVAAAELSKHGYTGDNGMQRFARLLRAPSLGIPVVYFTPFSRSRLNELDQGRNSPRNVSPEMFGELLNAGDKYGVPCLAIRWPTDATYGETLGLEEPEAAEALDMLRDVMSGLASRDRGDLWQAVPEEVLDAMRAQAGLPVRGSEVRLVIDLPLDVEGDDWLHDLLPETYMARGKADKVLAKMALDSAAKRPLPERVDLAWARPGRAQVLYLGYQWRPDPACGLIALSGELARRADLPLFVVWPRVFLHDTSERQELLAGLREFIERGTGSVRRAGLALGFSEEKLQRLQDRLNDKDLQFGVFSPRSKVGRILAENADLCVFGDALYLPR